MRERDGMEQQEILRRIPKVDELLALAEERAGWMP